jgi:transcriptional regulator with XRE-family HTH domain
MTVGENIKKVRISKHLTQKEVATRCGMADSAIRKYESGKQTPKLDTLRRIAKALGVDWTELVPADQQPRTVIEHIKEHTLVDDNGNKISDYQQNQQLYELYDLGESWGERGILEEMDDNGLGLRSDYACSLVRAFNLLNEQGQKAAAERVKELLEIARYRSWVNDDCFWAEDILKGLPSAPVRPAAFDVNDDPDDTNH